MASRLTTGNARGLRALAGMQGAPGVAPGSDVPSGRLHGKFGIVTWAALGSGVLLCSEWEITFEQEFADGTAHGEYWDIPVPIKQMWTGRVQAYVKAGGPGATAEGGTWVTWMTENILYFMATKTSGDPAVASFTGYATAPLVANQYIFKGDAYVSRSGLSLPKNGAATQEMTLRGYGAPATGTKD